MKTLTVVLAALVGLLVVCTHAQREGSILAIILAPQDLSWYKNPSALSQTQALATNQVSDPEPPYDNAAKMARFIVHYSMWGSLSHISMEAGIEGSPTARAYSISDGVFKESTGTPYFYITTRDPEINDLAKDSRASLTASLAQTPYCRYKEYDPEDPRCAQVVLTGNIVILKNGTTEWDTAEKAVFSRHPVMKKWPLAHKWVFCKLDIKRILVVKNFGGNDYPSVEDYFKAKPNVFSKDNPMLDTVFY